MKGLTVNSVIKGGAITVVGLAAWKYAAEPFFDKYFDKA